MLLPWQPALCITLAALLTRRYFYNTATLERQWHPPASWFPPPLHPAHAAAMAAAAHAAAAQHLAQAAAAASAAGAAAAGGAAAAVAEVEPSGSQAQTGAAEPGAVPGPSVVQPPTGSGGGSEGRDGNEAACGEAAGPSSKAVCPPLLPSDAAASAAAAAAPQPAVPPTPGYYYQDAYGVLQGPFSSEQLMSWRGGLPMDLVVRHRPPPAEVRGVGGVAGRVVRQRWLGGCLWVMCVRTVVVAHGCGVVAGANARARCAQGWPVRC